MPPNPIISVHKLFVTYFPGKSNEVQSLKNINLDIYPGEFICFFGPSGCGKSTLLYSISGLETNIQGDIIVQGKNLRSITVAERETFHQKIIGMIFQAYYLIPSLNILQNVALPQMAINGKKRFREERALQLLEHFGVGKQANKLPMELSGGQQQRVAISRSLINDPLILVADEPVGNLDTKSSLEVMSMLRELNEKEKKTVILVTHDPSHLHHAHRIFYMRDGEIIETKTNSEAERKESPVEAAAEQMSLPASIKHWVKTYNPDQLVSADAVFAAFKAHELATEVLTGFTIEEMGILERTIQQLLMKETADEKVLFETLHSSLTDQGLAIEERKSSHLAKRIKVMLTEIERVQAMDKRLSGKKLDKVIFEARELRKYLFDTLNVTIKHPKSIIIVDAIFAERLRGKIERAEVFKRLDLPLDKGGAGLDKRVARLLSRELEPLLPQIEEPKPASQPPPAAPPPSPIQVPPTQETEPKRPSLFRRFFKK